MRIELNREAAYAELVRSGKACRGGGVYDSNHIAPWSVWQGNLRAELLIVGQDWGDTRHFETNRGGESVRNPTNDMLMKLLAGVGIDISPPLSTGSNRGVVFLTNSILCLKKGGLQAKVNPAWFANCGSRFLKPSIDLVQPRVLVSLGALALQSITGLYGTSIRVTRGR